jgi:UMF1 family MFS transporter
LNGVADRRAIVAWTLYDFANSPFTTLVVTFVYARYFTEAVASSSIEGTALWGYAITATALIVAIGSPILGALADQGGYRKRFLLLATAISAGATAVLFGILPGQVLAALLVFVIANVAFEFATVFYNAYLPDLTTPANIGRVSGWGWGLGYFGGLLALGVALLTLVQPETPWFGFSLEAGENIRATNLLVAVWFVVFSLPLVFFVHDRKPAVRSRDVVADAFRQLAGTFREVRRHRETVKFLIARLVYNDGLVTIFAFGGIYAAGTFGFTVTEVLIFGIVINLAAGVGALLMGYMDDWLGAKRTILVSLIGLIVASIIGVFAENASWFWVAGVAIGIFSGPNQSASRSLMGRYVPPGMQNEFFGFFAFSGKLTAFIGPFLLSLVTGFSQSQRVGMTVVIMMFILGLMLLVAVKDPSQARSLE